MNPLAKSKLSACNTQPWQLSSLHTSCSSRKPWLIAVLATSIGLMMTGCENKTTSEPAQTTPQATPTQNIDTNITTEHTPTQPASSEPKPTVTPTATAVQAVGPSGFGGLTFGQPITDELLNELGLVKDDVILNESCYYVHDPKLTYMDDEFGERASVLYQIIDGHVALITVRDPDVPFYTTVNVGDSPAQVMSVHDDDVSYQVNKYSTDGDYYELLHDVNFDITTPPEMGHVLKKENYQLNDNAKTFNQTTPLQIKYKFREGQPLGQTDIAPDGWTDEQKGKLTGTLYNIDIGEPAAIRLVEGCS